MWYKESPLSIVWKGYNNIEGLQLMINIPNNNPTVLLPQQIEDNKFKDVFSKKVQKLLSNKDKEWWTKFKDDQQIIQPSESEIEEYSDMWNVESELNNNNNTNLMLMRRPRIIPPIRVNDHPLSINDFNDDDIIVYLINEKTNFKVGKIKSIDKINKEIKVHCYTKDEFDEWQPMFKKNILCNYDSKYFIITF